MPYGPAPTFTLFHYKLCSCHDAGIFQTYLPVFMFCKQLQPQTAFELGVGKPDILPDEFTSQFLFHFTTFGVVAQLWLCLVLDAKSGMTQQAAAKGRCALRSLCPKQDHQVAGTQAYKRGLQLLRAGLKHLLMGALPAITTCFGALICQSARGQESKQPSLRCWTLQYLPSVPEGY